MRFFPAHFLQKDIVHLFSWNILRTFRKLPFEWAILFAISQTLFCIVCVSFVSLSSVFSVSLWSIFAFFAIALFRGWGFYLSFLSFFLFHGSALLSLSGSMGWFWVFGSLCSFLLSWYSVLEAFLLLGEEEGIQEADQLELTSQLEEMKKAYDELLLSKQIESGTLLEKLENLQKDLDTVSCKYSQVKVDLQVLTEQKHCWLEDYTALHDTYIKEITGDHVLPSSVSWILGEKKQEVFEQVGSSVETECIKNQAEQEQMAQLLEDKTSELERIKGQLDEHKALLASKEEQWKKMSHQVLDTQDSSNYKSRYQQLRGQFEEQKHSLSSARKELFLSQEECLLLRKEKEEGRYETDLTDIELIHSLLSSIESLEQEVAHLEELVFRNHHL